MIRKLFRKNIFIVQHFYWICYRFSKGYIHLQKEKMRESIQQNYETIDILMNTRSTPTDQQLLSKAICSIFYWGFSVADMNNLTIFFTNSEQSYVELYESKNRKLKLGQWLDVKDTINQWLEA